jgi:hypothetical protein
MGIRDSISKALSAAAERAGGRRGAPGSGGGRQVPLEVPHQAPPPGSGQVDGWFGPGLPPNPTAPPSVAGRRNDYPVGFNMLQQPRPYQAVGFAELRALADGYDLLRLVIETRKDQMAKLSWVIGPRDDSVKATAEQKTRAKLFENEVFRRPDRENFWGDWLRSVLEDLLVIDAPAIHVRRTLGGDVYSLDQIDGATVKRIVDDGGRTPEPPYAAYQQVLKGLPAVNYSKADLIYRPRNMRIQSMYGYSPVEQVLMTVNIALRRQMWQLAYFTHGNIPDSLIGVPSTWTPDQIQQFQDWFDSLLSGNSQERRSARFVPGEVAKSYVPTKEAEIFGAAEEWLARVICFCFGVSHQALVKEVNRATADTAQEMALEEGLAPIMAWVKGLIDSILIDYFGELELEFKWANEKELDPKVQSEIHANYFGKVLTINEIRDDLGMDPDPSEVANMLGTISTDGTFVPIDPTLALKFKQAAVEAFTSLGLGPDGKPVPPPPEDPNDPNAPDGGKKPPPGKGSEGRAAPKEGEEVGSASHTAKLASASAVKRAKLPSTSVLRPKARKLQRSLSRKMADVLEATGQDVGEQVRRLLDSSGVHKATDLSTMSDEEIDALLAQLIGKVDLSGLDAMIDVTREDLEAMGLEGGRVAMASVGVLDREELVERVNASAVAYARERSAELVGKRVLEDGSIIDNPNAKWAIDESTREAIKNTISEGLHENIGSDAIVEALETDFAFSPERADMVSRTEIAMANSEAAMTGYREAEEDGVKLSKEWILGPAPCEICQENNDAGPIGLDDEFPSGDDTVPAHPNCECAVVAVVDGEETGAEA